MKLKKKIKLNQKVNFYPFIFEYNKDLPKWQKPETKPLLKNGK